MTTEQIKKLIVETSLAITQANFHTLRQWAYSFAKRRISLERLLARKERTA